jgi:hypothetical protein
MPGSESSALGNVLLHDPAALPFPNDGRLDSNHLKQAVDQRYGCIFTLANCGSIIFQF